MDKFFEYVDMVPPQAQLALGVVGAVVMATKFLSFMQFILGTFVMGGKNVSISADYTMPLHGFSFFG